MKAENDPRRKVDPRAVLKALPTEKQAEIYEYLIGGEKIKAHSCRATVVWLKKTMRIKVSEQTVGKFRRWYVIRLELNEQNVVVEEVIEVCKKNGWVKTAKEERMAAQIFFNRLVIDKKDPELWAIVEKVSLARDKIGLEKQEIKMEAKSHQVGAKSQQPAPRPQLTPDEKQERIRQILGTQ
jgi:hypothetical protein